jgi:hypothetical protein
MKLATLLDVYAGRVFGIPAKIFRLGYRLDYQLAKTLFIKISFTLLQVKRATLKWFQILFQVSPGVNSYKTCLSSSLTLRTNKPKTLCLESFLRSFVFCV